jgi:UDPglucose--hexose-1-phosphate uridylyltransferase
MPELRKDPIIGRWVIIATERAKRPSDFKLEEESLANDKPCPFCEGNEKLTPPEIDAQRPQGPKDSPGWLTRTVPNKYPALKNEPDLGQRSIGIFDLMKGIGAHEVIIESTDHTKQLADLSLDQMKQVIRVYKKRSIELGKDKRFKYVLIFKNYGLAAGASLAHSHTQLIALPVIPKRVGEEFECMSSYSGNKKSCVFCDTVKQERADVSRHISENQDFFAFCPFASRSPFEISIVPKQHRPFFTDITESEINSFAEILKDVLLRVKVLLKDPAYNFIIHTSPLHEASSEIYHWHVELMPKLSKIAGFEWGTGFYINLMSPELASEYLRKTKIN